MTLDTRGQGIAKIRQWARDEVDFGRPVNKVYGELVLTYRALLEEFHVEHDVAGVRYWLDAKHNNYFTTAPGEVISASVDVSVCVELQRHEYLSRLRLHFGYEDRI
jgi:chromosome condensin MukBEF ATPase and DNA-binding subunit MukB